MRILKVVMLGLLMILALLAIGGAVYQRVASAAEDEQFPPPGRLFDVDGLSLHMDCRGSGRPVILMEAGLTSGTWSWGTVQEALARTTQVCAYDRPGMGWSESIDHATGAVEVADRLHRLVEVAAIDGPYILLGMSAGGVYVREYYRRHPEDVVGMVLIDSSHEQQGNRLPEIGDTAQAARMLSICTWLQPLGLARLSGALDALAERPGIEASSQPMLRAQFNKTHYCSATLNEIRSFASEVRDAEPPAALGALPLLVLSQGKPPEADPAFGVTVEQARAMRAVWDTLQQELAALSTDSRREVAERSGHVIQWEQPELVVDTVSALVQNVRAGR